MPRRNGKLVTPKILVLEGLWGDTADICQLVGADATEAHPWDFHIVKNELLSGEYHGLVLTGGSDINPAIYGEEPHAEVYGIDNTRDAVELMALHIAKELRMAVLGICRGSQIMCAYRGGRLVQHIESHRGSEHYVEATEKAITFKRACNSRDMRVISLHHQCVAQPGRGMRIAATAQDGTPEAIESKDGLWLGCQFHPEMNAMANGNSYAIFEWLVKTAGRVAGGRARTLPFRQAQLQAAQSRARARAERNSQGDLDYQAWWEDNYMDPYHGSLYDHGPEASRSSQKALPPRTSRQAGDPAIPSMRVNYDQRATPSPSEMAAIIEDITGRPVRMMSDGEAESIIEGLAEELLICPHCGLEFDLIEDRDDHVRAIHKDDLQLIVPFHNAATRYPELEPPPGHPAWVDDDDDESVVIDTWLRTHGYTDIRNLD